jgi:hypothetical protein
LFRRSPFLIGEKMNLKNRRPIFLFAPDGDDSGSLQDRGGDTTNQPQSGTATQPTPVTATYQPSQTTTAPQVYSQTAPQSPAQQAQQNPAQPINVSVHLPNYQQPAPASAAPVTPAPSVTTPMAPSITEENMRDFNKRLEKMEGNQPSGMTDEALKAFNKRLEKMEGDAQGFAMMLFHENYQLRDRVRLLESKASPEGALVLTGDDVTNWHAYQQLGTPANVKQGLDRVTQLQGELDAQRHEALLRKVADLAQFRFQILVDRDRAARADGRQLEYIIRDEDVHGLRQPTAYIREGEQEQTAADFAREQWGDYLAVLQIDNQAVVPAPSSTPPTLSGTRFINQTGASGSSGNGRPADLVSRFQAEQAEAAKQVKNPLLR